MISTLMRAQESGDRSVVVHVRAHPTLSLLEDRLFALSCGTAGFQTAGDNLAQLAITADGETKLEAALEETSYALRASVTDPDPAKGLLVKNCQAFDGLGGSIQLVDDRYVFSSDISIFSKFCRFWEIRNNQISTPNN